MPRPLAVWVLSALLLAAGPAAAKEPDRSPAATLFGQPIYLDEVQPPAQAFERQAATDDERRQLAHAWQLDEIQRRIWKALADQFCATHDCEPTEEDYAAFEAGIKRAAAGQPKPAEPMIPEAEYQRLRAELNARLEAAPEGEEREATQKALAKLEEVHNWAPGQASRDVSRAMIYNWKFNKALYAEYGGRVIWQQIGLEPVGAYETWLKEHQAKGSFSLSDPELITQFWRYFSLGHLDVDDDFLKSAGLTHPFEKPWWLMDAPPPRANEPAPKN